MTGEGVGSVMLCYHFVLDRGMNLGYIVTHPRLTRGALARRRSCGVGNGPAAGLARLRREALGSPVLVQVETPKRTVRDEQFGSSILTHKRAGLPAAPPSIS